MIRVKRATLDDIEKIPELGDFEFQIWHIDFLYDDDIEIGYIAFEGGSSFIMEFYIYDEYQEQGYGTKVLQYYFEHTDRSVLEGLSNEDVVKFWEKRGAEFTCGENFVLRKENFIPKEERSK